MGDEVAMIVKVQLALSSTESNPPALIYNKDHSVETRQPVTKKVLEAMRGAPRKRRYFYAHMEGTMLHLDEQAPAQDW